MRKLGLFIAIVGSIACILYPPYLNGSFSGYSFILNSYKTMFGVFKVIDVINMQQLGIQLLLVNVIGIGLAIVGSKQEAKLSLSKSEKKAKIEEFDFLKNQILSLYESEPHKFENNETSLQMVERLKELEDWDFDLSLMGPIKTMLSVLK